MCGVAGYVTREAQDSSLIHRMCDVIKHRGPDDEGFHIRNDVALGIKRLSIIDVSSGHQPIYNEDGSIVIVYNGECYNFPELRRQLEIKGHRFSTQTDTECVVHLYEEYGDRCVEHLRGMFAFALWDNKRKRLLLARDRVGKKPLFYRLTTNGIFFGSELKALVQDQSLERRIDPIALHHFLTYQYVPAPWAIYQGINKLPPAHTLVFERGKSKIKRYWHLSYREKVRVSDAEAVEQLRELVRECTGVRLISERPLGALLSGGVDSSLVVAAMAEQTSGSVKTFTIGFDDDRYDERRYARMVADRFGTDHHELVVTPDLLHVIPKLVWHYDEPFADSSSIPTYYVAEMTRSHVTVALNGDGGDESFGGYQRYVANLLAKKMPVSDFALRAARGILNGLPQGRDGRSIQARGKRFVDIVLAPDEDRYARLMSYFNNEQKNSVYSASMREMVRGIDSWDILRNLFRKSDGSDLTDRMLDADVQTYLSGDLLVKMDIATMANSLEARAPMLDHKMMEFAAALPSHMKIRGRTSKYLLKKAARGLVPDEVLDRPKMGFGVPLASWLRNELRDLTRDTLTATTAKQRGYFDPGEVQRLLEEHDRGRDHGIRIWALLQFELWAQMMLDSNAVRAPVASFG